MTVFLNKFLKHILLILKLNNHLWKKYKSIKYSAQISVFLVVKKAPNTWKNNSQKNMSNFFVQIISSKQFGEIFLKWMVLKIFNFQWFCSSEKLFFSIKLLINLNWQKNTTLEIIVSQVISYNFCKIGLNPKELELLE